LAQGKGPRVRDCRRQTAGERERERKRGKNKSQLPSSKIWGDFTRGKRGNVEEEYIGHLAKRG